VLAATAAPTVTAESTLPPPTAGLGPGRRLSFVTIPPVDLLAPTAPLLHAYRRAVVAAACDAAVRLGLGGYAPSKRPATRRCL
jgi:hypothetical protein